MTRKMVQFYRTLEANAGRWTDLDLVPQERVCPRMIDAIRSLLWDWSVEMARKAKPGTRKAKLETPIPTTCYEVIRDNQQADLDRFLGLNLPRTVVIGFLSIIQEENAFQPSLPVEFSWKWVRYMKLRKKYNDINRLLYQLSIKQKTNPISNSEILKRNTMRWSWFILRSL